MAFLTITVEVPSASVDQLNQQLPLAGASFDSSRPQEAVQALKNLLDGISAGAQDADLDIAVRSTDPAVAANGGGVSGSVSLK